MTLSGGEARAGRGGERASCVGEFGVLLSACLVESLEMHPGLSLVGKHLEGFPGGVYLAGQTASSHSSQQLVVQKC